MPAAPHVYAAAAAAADGRDLDQPSPGFDAISDALEAIAAGHPVVVLDDEDRENEGDLILAADRCTEAAMAFVVRHTSGVVCVGMEGGDLDRLRIPLMVSSSENEEAMSTAFTVTVDLRHGTSTGISAADRAATMRALADPQAAPEDFKRPGHIFPLRYHPVRAWGRAWASLGRIRQRLQPRGRSSASGRPGSAPPPHPAHTSKPYRALPAPPHCARPRPQGGVLRRPGHTEASVDLARMAGCRPAGVLCEIVAEDGSMARTPQLLAFARTHGLRVITIADLIRYRLRHDRLVQRASTAPLHTRHGLFTAHAYRSLLDGAEHLALVAGPGHRHQGGGGSGEGVLARVHCESLLGDAFGAPRCDGGAPLDDALAAMATAGEGVLVYLRGQQGRGLGLVGELEAAAAAAAGPGAEQGPATFPVSVSLLSPHPRAVPWPPCCLCLRPTHPPCPPSCSVLGGHA